MTAYDDLFRQHLARFGEKPLQDCDFRLEDGGRKGVAAWIARTRRRALQVAFGLFGPSVEESLQHVRTLQREQFAREKGGDLQRGPVLGRKGEDLISIPAHAGDRASQKEARQ